MIKDKISNKILTIGCSWKTPRGGIAQLLYSYNEYVFSSFNFISNSCEGSRFTKLMIFIYSLVKTVFVLLFCRNIQIVHIHTASYNSFKRSSYYIKLAHFMKRKVVIHMHGGGFTDYYNENKVFVENVFKKCDVVVSLSDEWKSFYSKIPTVKRVVVIENIIPSPCKMNFEDDGKIHLLFLGLLVKEKGIYDLLDAFAKLEKDIRSKIKLHIGGNGDTQELISYIKENLLDDCVVFEGWVSGEKKIKLLNQCDIYVLPSYKEGLPISILEAMSYGMYILTCPVGGIPEVVDDNVNGKFIVSGDVNGMVKELILYSTNPDEYREKGKNSYAKVSSYFPEQVSTKLESIYRSLLDNNSLY